MLALGNLETVETCMDTLYKIIRENVSNERNCADST